jgi:hypothetical protein
MFSSSSTSSPFGGGGLSLHQQQQAIYLCNGTVVQREMPQNYLMDQANLLGNNLIGRLLDELVVPLKRLQLSDQERVALTALILLDGGKTDRD